MFFDLKLGCTSLLGVVGKDNALYWQSDMAGKMLGFKSRYFKYTFSTNTIKDIVPAKYKSSRKRYLNTKIVNHEKVLAMLQKSKNRYYQFNYTSLKYHDFFVTVSLGKRYYPFVRMCSERAVKATKFSDWLDAYKREVNDSIPTPKLLIIPCADSSSTLEQQPAPASSSTKQCSTSLTQECSTDITTTADTIAAAAAAAAASPSNHYPEQDFPSTIAAAAAAAASPSNHYPEQDFPSTVTAASPEPTSSPSSDQTFQPNAAADDVAASPRYTPVSPEYAPPSPRCNSSSPKYTPVSPEYAPPSPRYNSSSPKYTPVSPEYAPPSPRYKSTLQEYSPVSPEYAPPSPRYSPYSPPSPTGPPPTQPSQSESLHYTSAAAAASEAMHYRNPTLIQPTAIKFMPSRPMDYIDHYQRQQPATTLHEGMIQKPIPFSFWMNSIPPTEVYIFFGDKVTTFVPKC